MRSEAIQPLWVTGRGGGGRTHARKVVGPVARATGRYLVRARAHRVTPHRHVDRVGLRRESGPAQPGGAGGTCQPSRAGGDVLGSDVLRRRPRLPDIGKLAVPARILTLPGRPNASERRPIRRPPAEGARIAEPLASWLGEWRHAIDEHHERFDGTGYPAGLSGTEISLAGRIVAVAGALATMTAVRSYKEAVHLP